MQKSKLSMHHIWIPGRLVIDEGIRVSILMYDGPAFHPWAWDDRAEFRWILEVIKKWLITKKSIEVEKKTL